MKERKATSQSDQYWLTGPRINTLLKEIVKWTISIGNPSQLDITKHASLITLLQIWFFFWGGGLERGGGSSGQTCDKCGVFAPISISQHYLLVFRACVYLCSLFLQGMNPWNRGRIQQGVFIAKEWRRRYQLQQLFARFIFLSPFLSKYIHHFCKNYIKKISQAPF